MSAVILHVDDDPDIRATVARILADDGYTVLSFSTIKEALSSLTTLLPDLVLLDVMVEEQDSGLVAYDLLAQKYPQIPALILTSLGDMIKPYFVDRKDLVEILEKPIIPDRLLHSVRTQLQLKK